MLILREAETDGGEAHKDWLATTAGWNMFNLVCAESQIGRISALRLKDDGEPHSLLCWVGLKAYSYSVSREPLPLLATVKSDGSFARERRHDRCSYHRYSRCQCSSQRDYQRRLDRHSSAPGARTTASKQHCQ